MHAGVDEVGRGPLVGCVVAAAVILPAKYNLELNDSKKLTEKKRDALYPQIIESAISYAIAEVSAAEIDKINILQASLKAMKLAVEKLNPQPSFVWVDGNKAPNITIPLECVVQGDSKIPQIMAASIIAKVYRDNLMVQLHDEFPEYGFAIHKGYPTPMHLKALSTYGPTKHHRASFGPVKRILEQA